MKFCLMSAFLLFTSLASARLSFPKNMSSGDRKRALEVLGLSSTGKILGNPYPLGGFSGLEIGYAIEVIPTTELSTLGDKEKSQKETAISMLTLGKGFYYNVDMFLQFTPFTQNEDVKSFGAQIRWGFYQAEYVPAHLSLVMSGGSTNFQNKISTVSQGLDLIAGFSVKDMTLYTGLGIATAYGTFTGGTGSVSAPEVDPNTSQVVYASKSESVSSPHYVAGINMNFQKLFLAAQLDRYTQATYSAKLGFRF